MGTQSKWRRLAVGGGAMTLVVLAAAVTARACMDYRPRPAGLFAQVMSDDPAKAKAAVEKIRAMGPEGLGALMYSYDLDVGGHTAGRLGGAYPRFSPETFRLASTGEREVDESAGAKSAFYPPAQLDPAGWKRLSAAIDAVAAQKDAAYCGLYWYTDIEQAKAAAQKADKPILSLRLLGKLGEEFSCANSRYFRTVLYPNKEVSKALRERFVLHWQSVRPVPKVTIDMGDGRVIERTVTGNSIHYILDANGRPVDALPGLYGPRAFLRAITDAEGAVKEMTKLKGEEARRAYLADWHGERQRKVTEQFEQELSTIAAQKAFSNQGRPPIGAMLLSSAAAERESWGSIAALPQHREDAKLDAASNAIVRAKNPNAREAGARAMTKAVVEDPLARVLGNLERSVALDTVHNEFELHLRLHDWFARRAAVTMEGDVAALNERVYAELFLTPSSDPWLGLCPKDAYSALEGDGVVSARK